MAIMTSRGITRCAADLTQGNLEGLHCPTMRSEEGGNCESLGKVLEPGGEQPAKHAQDGEHTAQHDAGLAHILDERHQENAKAGGEEHQNQANGSDGSAEHPN